MQVTRSVVRKIRTIPEPRRVSTIEMILSFLAMKWYRIVSDLVIVCKNIHNLDAVVDWGRKVINLKLKVMLSKRAMC